MILKWRDNQIVYETDVCPATLVDLFSYAEIAGSGLLRYIMSQCTQLLGKAIYLVSSREHECEESSAIRLSNLSKDLNDHDQRPALQTQSAKRPVSSIHDGIHHLCYSTVYSDIKQNRQRPHDLWFKRHISSQNLPSALERSLAHARRQKLRLREDCPSGVVEE